MSTTFDISGGSSTCSTINKNVKESSEDRVSLPASSKEESLPSVTVTVTGVDVFGEARVSPSNVIVIGSGETKTAYVYVTADKEAKAGQYGISAAVSGLGTTTQEIALTANVVEAASLGNLKKALEVGLVIDN